MRYAFCMLVIAATVLTGCNWAGRTALNEPQPILGGSGSALDVLGQVGDAPPARFETPSYTGLQQNSFTEIGSDFDPDVSPDGKVLVYSSTCHSRSSDIYVKKVEGQTVTRLTSDPANDIQPSFSPDGSFIAYASDRSGNWDLYVMTADGQKPFQVTSTPSHEIHPSWSPDGSRLCYTQYNSRNGQWEVWIVEVANPANRKFLTYGLFPSWCPSSSVNRIAFQRARQRGTQIYSIWTVDLVDDEARFLTEVVPATGMVAAISPSWSPDGTKLAYTTVDVTPPDPKAKAATTRADRGDDIWVATIDGTSRVRLTGDDMNDWGPAWSPDGRVYFTSNRSGCDNVWSLKPLDTNIIQATRQSPQRVGSAKPPKASTGATPPPAATGASANTAGL